MAVMASWNGKTWGVSSQRIAALNGVSSSVELDTENSDDKAGSPATKTKALKLQSIKRKSRRAKSSHTGRPAWQRSAQPALCCSLPSGATRSVS